MKLPIDFVCIHQGCDAAAGRFCTEAMPGEELRRVVDTHQERLDAAFFVNSLGDRAAHPDEVMQVTEAEIEKTGLI